MHGPIGYGHGLVGVFGAIAGFIGSLILLAIVVAVLFFLIRFLIIGTKAAQLYLDTHRPSSAATPVNPVVEPAETPLAATGTTPTLATKPTPKPRTPRTPPTPS